MSMRTPKHSMALRPFDNPWWPALLRPDVHRGEGGFTTLTSVILAGGVASAIAVTLLLSGISSTRNALASTQGAQANAFAHTCAEQALQLIHDNLSYSGQGTQAFTDGTCAYTVTIGSGQLRTLTASGTVGSTTRKLKLEITALTPKITIGSWTEVAAF